MSQYSEMIGSFIRTGSYPMEADYIFPTEEALKEYYNDPINKTLLHKGWLKIVENAGNNKQALYWVTKKETNDELEFTKLLEADNIDEFSEKIKELENKLNQEIQDRTNSDTSIWGTTDPTSIPQDLNSILDLSLAIADLRKEILEDPVLSQQIKAIVGTEEDDIINYLQSLPYQSLTVISNTLDKLLNGEQNPEGLDQQLNDLLTKIIGDPTPSDEFLTLRNIEQFVRILQQDHLAKINNLQSELDQTQIGVGLSGDGSFSPDAETYYLKDATSITNALRILDGLVNQALSKFNITSNNTDIVNLNVVQQDNGCQISAQLLLSNTQGNELIKKSDGLYLNIKTEYSNGTLTFKVNDKIIGQHVLGFSALVESAIYDSHTESIVIVFKLLNGEKQTISIPVGTLIREWIVDNEHPDRVVELYREEVADGADKLSADVRLSTKSDNILEKDGNTLYVSGDSSKITVEGQPLSSVIEQLKNTDTTISNNLTNEINRATTAEENLSNLIQQEVQRATSKENQIESDLEEHVNRTDNPHNVTKEQLGLENVDNTSDLDKPVSNQQNQAIQQAVEGIKNEIGKYTINGYYINTNPVLNKTDVGLDQVDNTSDLDKPISTATQLELDKKAPINSPTFTGIPQISVNPEETDSSQRIPSTSWVNLKLNSLYDPLEEQVQQHINNNNNPHNVTPSQIGTYNSTEIDNKLQLLKSELENQMTKLDFEEFWTII